MKTSRIPAGMIVPRNETTPARLAGVLSSMERDGWTGRPVLVVDRGDRGYYAITGSHRIAAAEALGIDVVAYVIRETVENEDALYMALASDDVDAIDYLRKVDKVAADIMRQEGAE